MMFRKSSLRTVVLAAAITCAIGVSRTWAGDEKDLALEKVPKAVVDAVKAKFPDAKLTKAASEKEDGKEIVEVSFTVGETRYEAESSPEGKLIAIDKEMSQKDLPEKVAKPVESKYPGAKYKMVEEVTKDDKVAYHEIDLQSKSGESVELQVDPDGKIINEEKKGKEDKEEKDEKKKD